MDFYRGVDGQFLFKLCYPEVEGSNGGHCNEWYQTSNPYTDSVITGFESVNTEFELIRTKDQTPLFAGLGRNSDDHSSKFSAVSNSPLTANWWMAVGQYEQSQGNTYLIGPVEAGVEVVTVVELFVSKARLDPDKGVGLSGSLSVRCSEPGEDLDIGYNLKELQLTCTRE